MAEEQFSLSVVGQQTGAVFYTPDNGQGRLGAVVLLHAGGMDRTMCRPWAEALVAEGLAALAIDLDGHGDSTRPMTSLRQSTAPVAAAIDYLAGKQRIDDTRLAIWGLSLGGSLAIMTAARDERLKVIVTVGAPYRFEDYDMTRMLVAPGFWRGTPALEAPDKAILYAFIEALDDREVLASVGKIDKAVVLLVYGSHDLNVPLADGQYLHSVAAQPVYLWVKWLTHPELATDRALIEGIASWIASRFEREASRRNK
jgi:uncharacterized protein